MKRRDFIKSSSVLVSLFGSTNLLSDTYINDNLENFFYNFFNTNNLKDKNKEDFKLNNEPKYNDVPKDSIEVVQKPKNIIEDIYVQEQFKEQFLSVRKKLKLVQTHVGYGNFNIISFDDMLKVAKYSKNIGKFTKEELSFLESIFYYDPTVHGFFGKRISDNITKAVNKKEVTKIPHTGHYLFKGEPEKTYYKMIEDVRDSLTLTSGVRIIIKQTKLFLDKVHSVDGNLTLASKSLAPPAYTYHSISDFDVGKKGFGKANFSSRFALTEEFLKMRKLKYIDMRYTVNNKDGVRYEPWHIKII